MTGHHSSSTSADPRHATPAGAHRPLSPVHHALARLETTAAREAFLRERLRLRHPSPTPIKLWVGLGAVTLLAALIRLVGLSHPTRLVFDETYYVKDAFSLAHLGYAGTWPDDPNPAFERGDTSGLSAEAGFVVHPDVGKFLISLGIRVFGVDSSFGWRVAAALAGIASVWLVGRIAARLFRSTLLATTTAGLLALDGIHITESRVALLDIFLSFFALLGLWALLRDREHSRSLLAARIAADPDLLRDPWGPHLWWRPWLLLAGIFLGLAIGVKWSGAYALAVFGLTVFAWDTAARRAVGCRLWVGAGVFRGGVPAFVNLVPVAALTYLASWASWFTHAGAYDRTWAADLRASGAVVPRGWLPDALNSLIEYHLAMYRFHVGLSSEHTYMSNPWGWLLQVRPTSLYWQTRPGTACGAGGSECAEAITALGNPAIWWIAAAMLLVVVWGAIMKTDWRAWTILVGYIALYVPWLAYTHRTIFTFYTVAFVPFVCLAWVYGMGALTGHLRPLAPISHVTPDGTIMYPDRPDSPSPTRAGRIAWWSALTVVAATFVFFLPIWTGLTIPKWLWQAHMWFPSWV
ncbi:MAG: phospholipid carrier-dependent glycosyltransferase [Bowdeniella nasicola]|nr:phospholipid carrier-dependent glycosyltransferase [Bowdeniella nasicola]